MSCAWVVGMQLGITAKERLGVDGYLEMAELVS
jgi:hypothetical protein